MSSPRPAERPGDREQLRSRALAFAGLWFLLAGMLAALGLGIVLVASLALLVVGGLVVAGIWLARRYRMGHAMRVAGSSLERASRQRSRTLQGRVRELGVREHLQHAATVGSQQAHKLAAVGSEQAHKLATAGSEQAQKLLEVRPRSPASNDPGRRARRLNELGAQLRRDGEYEQAAEQHRRALTIVHELGDRRAEALTLNNLALALVHTGGVTVAVERFDEALGLLRELGDEELEGQVIANLGFVRRRQGRDEDAESLLNEALDKLPPESSAYRHVQEQLRRAS